MITRRDARFLSVLLLILLMHTACTAPQQSDTSAGVDPGLELQTLSGDSVTLGDYGGQIVMVNFWATWCGPCRVEMPLLEAYYQEHRETGFVLLAVNAMESANRARAYIEEGGYTFPVMLDSDGLVAEYFGGTRGMPTTIVIDRTGQIAYRHVGQLDETLLNTHVTPLLP